MYTIGQSIKLTIEKMVYEGYGLAHAGYDGGNFVFFVDRVCDGDTIIAEITKLKKNYGYAKVKEIIKPSEYRVKPFCHLFNACGGCQWQFIDYNHQLEIKQNIVQEILSKTLNREIEVKETLASPENKEYRHKIQMPVSQTKNSKRFIIGYYKPQTHNIVNIKYCAIQPEYINEITDKIRILAKEYNLCAYDEKTHNGELRHIIFRIAQSSNEILLCFVVNNNKISKNIYDLGNSIFSEYKNIKGISINFNTGKNNVILGEKTVNILGDEIYKEKINDITYIISPDSFFQVNPKSFKNILDTVKNQIAQQIENPTILDAYSGVGSFGLYLSKMAKHITCVEEVKSACKNTQTACDTNNIKNITILNGDAKKIFRTLSDNNQKFDVIILDPPRKGCDKDSLDFCNKLTDKFIVYVSCNPNSLARDIKYLNKYGFELYFAQTADMFCHTYHIETITVLKKNLNT